MTSEPEGPRLTSPFRVALTKGKQAAWENRIPGLFLWFLGIAIIVGYYQSPWFKNQLQQLGTIKEGMGWKFAVISTALFGGILPVLLPFMFGKPSPTNRRVGFWPLLASNAIFWGYKGWEVDQLYQFQAWAFGHETNIATVTAKVVFDMAVYAPLIGLLNCVLFYIWRDNGYSFSRTHSNLGNQWYSQHVLPALITNFCVWCPSVIIIYNLPLPLQLPVQNLILCIWVLVLAFFTTKTKA